MTRAASPLQRRAASQRPRLLGPAADGRVPAVGHPFRFAVRAASAPEARAWRSLARQVEDLGNSTLFIPDHLGEQWGPLVALTVAAEAAERRNVGDPRPASGGTPRILVGGEGRRVLQAVGRLAGC